MATQLRAFSGELNGIAFLHESNQELSLIARAADEIAARVDAEGLIDTPGEMLGLANRVRTFAAGKRDPAYVARLSAAASVLSAFIQNAAER